MADNPICNNGCIRIERWEESISQTQVWKGSPYSQTNIEYSDKYEVCINLSD